MATTDSTTAALREFWRLLDGGVLCLCEHCHDYGEEDATDAFAWLFPQIVGEERHEAAKRERAIRERERKRKKAKADLACAWADAISRELGPALECPWIGQPKLAAGPVHVDLQTSPDEGLPLVGLSEKGGIVFTRVTIRERTRPNGRQARRIADAVRALVARGIVDTVWLSVAEVLRG